MSTTREQVEESHLGQPGRPDAGRDREPDSAGQTTPEELVVEELLVEDVSIDGMCGVY